MADPTEPPRPDHAVIVPGQEPLVQQMLGGGEDLPATCAWKGASIGQAAIRSTYLCDGEKVVVGLHHRDALPHAARTTDSFAILVEQGPEVAGLLGALARRVRAREAAFRWKLASPPPPTVRGRTISPGSFAGAGIFAGLVLLGVIAALVARRLVRARPRPSPPASPRRALARLALPGGAIAVVLVLRESLHFAGEAASVPLRGQPLSDGVRPSLAALLALVVALFLWFMTERVAASPLRAGLFVPVALLSLAVGYAASFEPPPTHGLGRVVPFPPRAEIRAPWPAPPGTIYRTNGRGFRGPDFTDDKPAGTRRIAVVGDSFVFGMGVGDGDVLPVRLQAELSRRHPGRPVEVLNLGVPGDNLAAHVDLVDDARALSADLVIVGLVLANDLSRWDAQAELRARGRPGLYSLVRHLLGKDFARTLWDTLFLERLTTPAGLDHLERELARLDAIRRAGAPPPPLVLLLFHPLEPAVGERLAHLRDAVVVAADAEGADLIPGDGHPTPAGHRRIAALLADAIEDHPALRAIVGEP